MANAAYKVEIKKENDALHHTVQKWDEKGNGGTATFTTVGGKEIPDNVKVAVQCLRNNKHDDKPITPTNAKKVAESLLAIENLLRNEKAFKIEGNLEFTTSNLPLYAPAKLKAANADPDPINTVCSAPTEAPTTPAVKKSTKAPAKAAAK